MSTIVLSYYFDEERAKELKWLMEVDKFYDLYEEELYSMHQQDADMGRHLEKFYNSLSQELLRYHHKRRFFKKIHDELLPIALHLDRWWNWCIPKNEKRVGEKLWK